MPPLRRIKRKSIGELLEFQVDAPPSSATGGGDSHKLCGQEKHASSVTSSGINVKDNDGETCEYDEIWDDDGSMLLMKKTIKKDEIGGKKYGKENRVVGTNEFHALKKRQGSNFIRREKFISNQEEVDSRFPVDPPRQSQVLEDKNRYPHSQSADAPKVSTGTNLSRLSGLVAASGMLSYDGRREKSGPSQIKVAISNGKLLGSQHEVSDCARKQKRKHHGQGLYCSLPREDKNTSDSDHMMDPLRSFTGREKYKRPSLVTGALDKPSLI